MNWGQFKDALRTYLLVDSERKGRGIQKYIDRLSRAALIDLQRYVPQLKTSSVTTYRKSPTTVSDWSSTKTYKFGDVVKYTGQAGDSFSGSYNFQAIADTTAGDSPGVAISYQDGQPINGKWTRVNFLTPTSEGVAQEGLLDIAYSEISECWVRRWPTTDNKQDNSAYFKLMILPWERRYSILDGVSRTTRTCEHPGLITFGRNEFILSPALADDEKLLINWVGEKHFTSTAYWPDPTSTTVAGAAGTTYDTTLVTFDDMEAKAMAEYVKAHLQREVDNDLRMYESYMAQYRKSRQEIFRQRKEFKPAAIEDPHGVDQITVGKVLEIG